MRAFGWLTITPGDLGDLEAIPAGRVSVASAEPGEAGRSIGEEFHLGAFDVAPDMPPPFTTH